MPDKTDQRGEPNGLEIGPEIALEDLNLDDVQEGALEDLNIDDVQEGDILLELMITASLLFKNDLLDAFEQRHRFSSKFCCN